MFVLPFESLQQLDYLLNYFGCQQTAICNEGMFSHIMTTDSWCQTGYAFQFVSGNNNNYSSCKSSLHYSMNSFCCAYFPKTLISTPVIEDRRAAGRTTGNGKTKRWTLSWLTFDLQRNQSSQSSFGFAPWNVRISGVVTKSRKRDNGFGKHGEIKAFSDSLTQILQLVLKILLLFN